MSRAGLTLTLAACAAIPATALSQALDPPPVDERALAMRLADMTRPSAGERAIILYDPTYYPGITTRLREELHRRGVFTYVLVEETPAIVESYLDDDERHAPGAGGIWQRRRSCEQRDHLCGQARHRRGGEFRYRRRRRRSLQGCAAGRSPRRSVSRCFSSWARPPFPLFTGRFLAFGRGRPGSAAAASSSRTPSTRSASRWPAATPSTSAPRRWRRRRTCPRTPCGSSRPSAQPSPSRRPSRSLTMSTVAIACG